MPDGILPAIIIAFIVRKMLAENDEKVFYIFDFNYID